MISAVPGISMVTALYRTFYFMHLRHVLFKPRMHCVSLEIRAFQKAIETYKTPAGDGSASISNSRCTLKKETYKTPAGDGSAFLCHVFFNCYSETYKTPAGDGSAVYDFSVYVFNW